MPATALNWLTGVQDEFTEKAKTVTLAWLAALGDHNWYRHLRRRCLQSAVAPIIMVATRRGRHTGLFRDSVPVFYWERGR